MNSLKIAFSITKKVLKRTFIKIVYNHFIIRLKYVFATKNCKKILDTIDLESIRKIPGGTIERNTKLNDITCDLSIIIPCYNVSKYIKKRIDSIIDQDTYVNYEIILVNDGSTDNTLDIISEYKDDHRIKIITTPNKGVSHARNTGVETACGKYFIFVDGDDYLLSNSINTLYNKITEEDFDIVQGQYTGKHRNKKKRNKLHGAVWPKIYNRDLFKNIKFPEGYYYEDTINILIIFLLCKKVDIIDDVVYNYTYNENSITNTSKSSRTLDIFYITLLCANYLSKNNLLNDKAIENLFIQLTWNYRTLEVFDKITQYTVFIKTSEAMKNYFRNKKEFKYKALYKALSTNNYSLYKAIMMAYSEN